MKKFLLINLSPRPQGTSFTMLHMCQEHLASKGHQTELFHLYQNRSISTNLLKAVEKADTLVFCGPCYINTYPAETTAFLMELYAHREVLHGQSLYGMIQGGMPYPHTHESGLAMLQVFCHKCNISYQGGFIMGFGAILDGKPLTNLPNSKRVIKQLKQFFQHIEKDETAPPEVYLKARFKVPGFIYGIMAKGMNRHIDNDLKKHGIDVKQESPYLLSK